MKRVAFPQKLALIVIVASPFFRIGPDLQILAKTGTSPSANPSLASQMPKSQPLATAGSFGTERAGFEPAVGVSTYTDLANRRIRPLCHLSRSASFDC